MTVLDSIAIVAFTNFIPTAEQLGAIPLGLALGLDPLTVLLVSVIVNTFLFVPTYVILHLFYKGVLSKIKFIRNYLQKVQTKGKPYIDRYGILGVTAFIALPTPFTGTYTGSILCWAMNLDWKRALLAIFLGSFIGGIIIVLGVLGIVNLYYFLAR